MIYALTSGILEITEAVTMYALKKTILGVYNLGYWALYDKQSIKDINDDYVLVQTDVINVDNIERGSELEKIINSQTQLINDMHKELLTLKDKIEKKS